uniref:GNAT family N-acetyltransferase n=1 Tax=Ignisphaera aggregans TaxID=334771 RepID=A0A7C2V8P8_9CREN
MDESDSEEEPHSRCIDLIIRRARVADVDGIVEIYNSSIEYLDFESREWIESVVKKRSRRARIYVAISDGKVVGFLLLYKKRDKAYIDAFAIDAHYRGRRIGSCLLTYVENTLASEGVHRIFLTVKNNNHKAMNMYIKHGYKISNVVLILEATSNSIEEYQYIPQDITIKIDSIRRSALPKVKLLDTTLWSNFTWDIDEVLYRVSGEEATVVSVYKSGKILGIARIYIHQDKIVVDRLAVSFYKPTEWIKIMIHVIRSRIAQENNRSIVIPVDSTKASLLKSLISLGFKVRDSEYVLHKDITELVTALLDTIKSS